MVRFKILVASGAVSIFSGMPVRADEPFWRTKEKYVERVRAGEPVVSVSSHALAGDRRRMTIRGGGRVEAPLDFTFDFARRLDRVARLTGYVERAEVDATGKRLHLTFAALGRKADFDLRVTTDEPKRRIEFEILGGPLRGLVAALDFRALEAARTEVAIDGHYDYETFPFKGLVLGVGLETVFKTMAERLRDGVVAARKAEDKPGEAVEESASAKRSREP